MIQNFHIATAKMQQKKLIKSKHDNKHFIKQVHQSVWYFHLFAWCDWDSPDTVHIRRVAVGETGRGEVPTAVLQTVSTSLKKQTESPGQRWFIIHICEDSTRAQHAEAFIHHDVARCHAKRWKEPKKVILMPKWRFSSPSIQSCMLRTTCAFNNRRYATSHIQCLLSLNHARGDILTSRAALGLYRRAAEYSNLIAQKVLI